MVNSLQKQLTRSHLLVTLVSTLVLSLLVLAGYYIYLKTPYPAQWAGHSASANADELAYLAEYWEEPLDEALAQEYLTEITDVIIYGEELGLGSELAELMDKDELIAVERDALTMLILDAEGYVLASDSPLAYPTGQLVTALQPPGFQTSWLDAAEIDTATPEEQMRYGQSDGLHIGFAPILDSANELLGWVYYRDYDQPAGELLAQTAIQLSWISLGAVLVAMAVAGVMGRRVSKPFAQRLHQVTEASAALAAGNIDQRVRIDGDDEIAKLGNQFNQMAAQLATQMRDLRDLADTNAQLAQEASSLAAVEERNRLARDLHDAIKQKLFGLNLTAGAVKSMVQKDLEKSEQVKGDMVVQRLEQLSQMTTETIEEMDQIIQQLRPAALENQGLVGALAQLIDGWQEQTGIPVEFVHSGTRELPLHIEHGLYRVTQEALTNVLKHATAQHVFITLEYGTDVVQLTVQDDGKGFAVEGPRAATALGLESMVTRVKELDGTFHIESTAGSGTQIEIQVPSAALERADG